MNKRFNRFKTLSVVLCMLILASCTNSATNTGTGSQTASSVSSENSSKNAIKITSNMLTYDKDDYYSEWKSQNPNYIKLNGTGASLTGSGATVNGSKVTITAAGVYAISGKLDNGQIIVDVKDKGVVRLILNGVEINCTDNAPIYVKNAGKTIVSLQEGTQNTITDGSKYVLSDSTSDEPSAAIFSKDNLTVNGAGKLIVRASYKDGIASKDDMKITGGSINITSVDDGLVGRDMVLVKEGNISIEAGGDGVKATNDTDTSKGFVALEGGAFNIKTGTDGIQAETSVLITGGKFTITTGGGSANAPVKVSDMGRRPMDDNTTASTTNEAEKESKKAIKATSDITISGGTISIDSFDDAVHSNNSVNITGGDISITSGDDGIHADSSIAIKDGKINITKSYEGIESTNIHMSGGETHVVSSDDGVNVSGGNDGSSVNGRPGQNDFSAAENSNLVISGGYISVDSSGDGLDSNGSIIMTDGTAVVNGPTANNNAALDYNGTFEMSGGFLIAAGSAGMSEAPSEKSTQYSINMYYTNMQQAGTLVNLKDSNGNTVATFAPKKEYQSVVISSPALKKEATYTLNTGGTSTGSATDGLYNGGVYQGGTKVVDFTIANSVTWLSETGVTAKKSFNPGGPNDRGFGGKGGRPDRAMP
ncbi:MAG: carbohydrate-binding domain-containing protein [Clostridia bacterium]|nr:carbohydrate-binding domain-containing protein [Clostridia bacterium]